MFPIPRAAFLLVLFIFTATTELATAAPQPLSETWKLYNDRYPAIQLPELKKAIDDKTVTLIDANSPETYSKGHIPGALSLPALIKKEETRTLPSNKAELIVVYCGGPQCSAWFKAADYAVKQGYRTVRHYKGGLKEWKEKGESLETSPL
ncbi:rhodanese-like domain-containing protein [Parendozoicomonas sp. Alg238-R29]|uniref:rhodanese-like domain-containing protein n=1 Tax=Parendozoicomonas sp. Alg238-R29 TaxID=2993446 RepID=UPI00248E8884|nr:rhodanese-like domain-containing protein [Parendozoicomonas sp. Alg238-R29]